MGDLWFIGFHLVLIVIAFLISRKLVSNWIFIIIFTVILWVVMYLVILFILVVGFRWLLE